MPAPGVTFSERLHRDRAAERRALVEALRAPQAAIPPKYFYDALGCALFEAICELPQYYPTRTERAIFARHGADVARAIGEGAQLVDLGAGDCAKAEALLPRLRPERYVAVDIAAEALRPALARLAARHPGLRLHGVVTDFAHGLDLRDELEPGRTAFFYPGSSIGNFSPEEALAFVHDVRAHCSVPGSGLLIGVDTPKAQQRLVEAYDDALGVTAAFNRNALLHVNRVLGCAFDPAAFRHVALYDDAAGRIEMHLEARHACQVVLDGLPRRFAAGERIHTENSYKYAPERFAGMLRDAGFAEVTTWQDDAGDFSVHWAR